MAKEKNRHPRRTTWWALHRNGPVGYVYGPEWAPRLFRTRAEARKYEKGMGDGKSPKALFTAVRVSLVRQ